LTLSNYIRLSEQYPEFARHAPPVGDRWFVFVQSVEPAGEALTLDLEVEQNHTYLANGMVTHNSRRGANMAVLRVDHPDIEEFITCKTDENAITNFNISVGITDAFMRAVENDEEWELRFPDVLHPAYRNFRGTLEDAERAGIPIRVYKRVRARDLFRKIATQAHHNGEPGVLFLDTANRSNPVPHLYTLEATNPCGEQWLGPFENCCLGSVNLARHVKYVNGKAEVDWEKLRETVEWATRFLDNVVQVNQYVPAVPQLKEAAFKTRRIGLGFMGLADLMYHLRIRYGSEEGQEFAAQIAEFIRYHAMRTSIELARERGPFPAIRGSIYDPEDLKWEPPKPLKPYTRDWGRPPLDWNAIVEGIRRHGIRNAAQTTVAPTGCLVAGTMIITDRGLLPIEALGDPNGPQWQDVDWVVASEGGPRRATKFYVNGVAHTLRLVTRRGYVLQGTDGHRVRVWENGKWVWRRLDELKPGMRIPIVAGMIGTPQRVELDIPANKDPRCTDVRFPSHITPELAYLVGFFMGDGSLKQRSMRLSVSDPELKEELVRRIREVFGVEPRLLQDPRSRRLWSVEIHSKLLVEFWRKNGFNKIPARPGHRGKGYQPHVPIKILQTNDPRIYGAFLAGLLDADGMIQRGHLISWSTTCREFHDQVKAMLLALGVLTTSDVQQTGISGAPLYRLRTAHAEATRRLVQQLELLLRLRVPGSNGHVRRSYLRDTIPLSDWEKNSLLAIAGSTKEQMRVWGWRQRGLANRETAIAFVQAHREDLLHAGLESFVQAVEQPVFYDEIVAIEDGGWRETYDLSVPGTHAYIANGFVSHNTLSTVAGCEGYGCEPVFALAYIRYVHEAEGRLELRYVSPLFMRALKEAGLDEETRARIIEEVLRKGTCQHIQELPDWIRHTFVVAQDLTPEEHVWMQASIQAFIDNSISKTINFPETATVEDVEKAYLLAWKLGCKGLTVYVAGSRQKEVLETLETKARKEQKEAAMVPAQPTLPQPVGPTVRPRPQKLAGVTYRIATPVGTAFITLNENGEGQPFEVFLNVGKAGSDIAAVAEAIGRLISLLLRLPSPVPPAERLRQVVDQLQGIGGGRALGFGPERVRSLPDGIARVLAEYLAERGLELPAAPAPAVQPALPLSEPHPGREEPGAMGPVGDICPQCGEATLLEQEGCRTCYNCGYSEC
jgi:ribonucleotide reductase alpha subunit